MRTPRQTAITAAIRMPPPSRVRLAAVSVHSSRSPVRWSGSVAIRQNVSAMSRSDGSSLSAGFSRSRMWLPMA